MALVVEVVVDRDVNGSEFLQGLNERRRLQRQNKVA